MKTNLIHLLSIIQKFKAAVLLTILELHVIYDRD